MSMSSKTSFILLSVAATAVTILGIFIWKQKRNKTYVRVGKVKKLFFYPVKSLKPVEVTEAHCTDKGLEVDGFLDRSFMLISESKVLLSQREAPRLTLLSAIVSGNNLSISGPDIETLSVEIKHSVSPEDKIVDCKIHTDSSKTLDCGDEAAAWFQSFLDLPGVRLVHYLPEFPDRKYMRSKPFYSKVKKEFPIAFQDFGAFNLLSEASVEDLNSKLEDTTVSVKNFRTNIFVDECDSYSEDSWKYLKFSSGVELSQILLCGRCIMTTNNPDNGVMTKKEPLVTLRKYRIPKDRKLAKLLDHVPSLGINCAIVKRGLIKVGDDIHAVVETNSA